VTQRDVSQGSQTHSVPLERQLAAFASLQRPTPALLDIVSAASRSATALDQHVQEAFASLQRPNPALLDIVSAASNSFPALGQYVQGLGSLAGQLGAQVAPILDRCLDVSPVLRVLQPLLSRIEELYSPGSFLGDVALVTDPEYDDTVRLEALDRLADKWFKNPVHPARWWMAEPELRVRANEHGTSMRVELRAATVQAIPLALAEVDEDTLLSEYLPRSRTALANRLMDDLAGPEWRRRSNGSEITLDLADLLPHELDIEYQAEVRELRQALARLLADLPRGQRAALLARLEGRPLTNAQHQALYRLRHSPDQLLRLQAVV